MHQFQQLRGLLRGRDRGTVAITFMVSLPILLFILSIITQYALIINARIALGHAVAATARSAMVMLPTDPQVDTLFDDSSLDGVVLLNRAAHMELASISPRAQGGASQEAQDVSDALMAVGAKVGESYADRFTFAEQATTIEWERLDNSDQPIAEFQWQPADFAAATGQRIRLTVHYNFQLTAPGAKLFLGNVDTIAGVSGRFLTLTASYVVQLSHGREVPTDNQGTPLQTAP